MNKTFPFFNIFVEKDKYPREEASKCNNNRKWARLGFDVFVSKSSKAASLNMSPLFPAELQICIQARTNANQYEVCLCVFVCTSFSFFVSSSDSVLSMCIHWRMHMNVRILPGLN